MDAIPLEVWSATRCGLHYRYLEKITCSPLGGLDCQRPCDRVQPPSVMAANAAGTAAIGWSTRLVVMVTMTPGCRSIAAAALRDVEEASEVYPYHRREIGFEIDHLLAKRRRVLLSPCRGRRTPGVDGGKTGQEFPRNLRASRLLAAARPHRIFTGADVTRRLG